MNKKQNRVLEAVFARPERSDLSWKDVEGLIVCLGGKVQEGKGSRVRFFLNDVVAVFHRPHPEKNAKKATVKSVREFLLKADITP